MKADQFTLCALPTVDPQVGSIEETGLRAGEERDRVGNIIDTPNRTRENLLHDAALDLRQTHFCSSIRSTSLHL